MFCKTTLGVVLFALTALLSGAVGAQDEQTAAFTIKVSHDVLLDWTASAPVNGDLLYYEVYRGTVSGGPYTLLTPGGINALDYDDLTVASGTTYFYVVTALDTVTGEQSASSNQVTAVVPTP